MPRYLERRRRRWYAVLDIPKDVREPFGKKRHVESLGTDSLSEAERLVLPKIALWKSQFQALRSGSNDALHVLAEQWRAEFSSADADVLETLDGLLQDKAEEIAWRNPKAASRFNEIVRGESISLEIHVDRWLASLTGAPKSTDMKRSDVRRFIEVFPYSSDVSQQGVQGWIYDLETQNRLKSGTVTRIISACRGYWQFLIKHRIVEVADDPFAKLSIVKRKRRSSGGQDKRQPFSTEEVIELLDHAQRKDDPQLAAVIQLGMWTGCRIEELCSLKLEHLSEDSFRVDDAKSEAGLRTVPIHSQLAPTLEHLIRDSTDGYVVSGLTFNKYGDRSNAVGKRFGTLKKRLGHGPNKVFHSIRKTVATLLENAGVPENVAADILGHDKDTMTYGLYSGGIVLEVKKEAIEKTDYPAP
ncbi:tyrosine-type recombinase/integrase [Sulfitobacter sp. D35]|uniref:tyrosine-type recombinase/integrase n=1 Tax=Sulfitobacter sp. D35 TaxID=3083252 RepID=UPI00296FD254|nr:tyrosine-type recombinase/integrase [Sulfitobacter sp. D35]MDW4500064.1 tyrosine-type recombinase/integrase [Sulfitobacter sp. D35]